MNDIIKTCIIHGPLTIDQTYKAGTKAGKVKHNCKECMKVYNKQYYIENRYAMKTKARKWQTENTEKAAAIAIKQLKSGYFKKRNRKKSVLKSPYPKPFVLLPNLKNKRI